MGIINDTFKLKGKEYPLTRFANGEYAINGKSKESFVSSLKQERQDKKYGKQLKLF